jgi:hypothetical protein
MTRLAYDQQVSRRMVRAMTHGVDVMNAKAPTFSPASLAYPVRTLTNATKDRVRCGTAGHPLVRPAHAPLHNDRASRFGANPHPSAVHTIRAIDNPIGARYISAMDNGEEPASPSLRKAEELLEQARTLLAEARDSGEVTEQGKGILTAVMFLLQSHVDLVVNVEIREDNPEPDFTD